MIDTHSMRKIELKAARMAVEWKCLFAEELQFAALQLAIDSKSESVTVEHLLQALPTATAKLLDAAVSTSTNSKNVRRRSA